MAGRTPHRRALRHRGLGAAPEDGNVGARSRGARGDLRGTPSTGSRTPIRRSLRPTCSSAIRDCRNLPVTGPVRAAAGSTALIVARMSAAERYKGHDALLDLWPGVLARRPDARLVVAGDGDDRPRLESRARSLGLSHAVSFAGRVSDARLNELYDECRFLVMPSRDEGFGLVFLEAMRAGKPCIGARGAAEEIIEHNVTGLIVDPGNPASEFDAGRGCQSSVRRARHLLPVWRRRPRAVSLDVYRCPLSDAFCAGAASAARRRRTEESMNILGLNAYHGDVSAVLVRDGQLIAAIEEERFRRIKHCAGFPHRAIAECLRIGGVEASDIDLFAVSRRPRRASVAQGAVSAALSSEANHRRPRPEPGQHRKAVRHDRRVGRPRRAHRPAAHAIRRAPSGAYRQLGVRQPVRRCGRVRH